MGVLHFSGCLLYTHTVMKGYLVLALLCALFAATDAQAGVKCKPNIERDTPGINYDRIVDLYVKAKKIHDRVESTKDAVNELDTAIADSYDNGLDAIVQAIRDLGYELKPEKEMQRVQV